MAIHAPGEKFRYHRLLSRKKGKREVTALLSLTAMVDMFTVLVIFLLQNYNTEGLIVNIPKDLLLPRAEVIKVLKPSIIVTVSPSEITLDDLPIAKFSDVKAQKEWMVQTLYVEAQKALEKAKLKAEASGVIKDVKAALKPEDIAEKEILEPWKKITVQAHKEIDFLTIKKILFTLTEAGAGEINFAVLQRPEDKK
jgi:biopolymer transport protein ExbD